MSFSPWSRSSSSILSATGPLWDPEAAFEIENPARRFRTCVGYAKTCRRRCENHIAMNWAGADNILRELSMSMPNEVEMRNSIEQLAWCMLCPRWHQDQLGKVVAKWCRTVRNDERRLRNQTEHSPSTNSRPATSRTRTGDSTGSTSRARADSLLSTPPPSSNSAQQSQSASRSPPSGSVISPPPTGFSFGSSFGNATASPFAFGFAEAPTNAPGQFLFGVRASNTTSSTSVPNQPTSTGQPSQQVSASAPATSVPASSSSTLPAQASSIAAPAALTQAHTALQLAAQTAAHTTRPPAPTIQAPAQASAPAPPQPIAPLPCTARHGHRRSIDEDCPICTTLMVNAPLRELVWCKSTAGCGRSVHRECFAEWRRQAVQNGIVPTCVYCRSTWLRNCRHDGTTAPAFSIWQDSLMWDPELFNPKRHQFSIWSIAFETDLPALFNPRRHRTEFDAWNGESYNGISKLFHIPERSSIHVDFWDLKSAPLRALFRTKDEESQQHFWNMKGRSGIRELFKNEKPKESCYALNSEEEEEMALSLVKLFEEPISKPKVSHSFGASSGLRAQMEYFPKPRTDARRVADTAKESDRLCACFSGCFGNRSMETR